MPPTAVSEAALVTARRWAAVAWVVLVMVVPVSLQLSTTEIVRLVSGFGDRRTPVTDRGAADMLGRCSPPQ